LKAIYLIIALLFFTSCKDNNKHTKPNEEVKIAKTTSKTHKMLQGTWVNVVDTLSTISFEGNTSKNSYNGVDNGRNIFFTVDNTCATNQSVTTGEENKYLNTTGAAEECYYIKTLTKDELELQLVAEEIVLKFRKK